MEAQVIACASLSLAKTNGLSFEREVFLQKRFFLCSLSTVYLLKVFVNLFWRKQVNPSNCQICLFQLNFDKMDCF